MPCKPVAFDLFEGCVSPGPWPDDASSPCPWSAHATRGPRVCVGLPVLGRTDEDEGAVVGEWGCLVRISSSFTYPSSPPGQLYEDDMFLVDPPRDDDDDNDDEFSRSLLLVIPLLSR